MSAASAYSVGTTFSTVNVASNSVLTIKSYIDLDVNDASGNNISGIDVKILEDSVQKYATSYFGGSDSKTDSNGTISTFLINSKKYDGSSTSTAVPTYVSLYSSPDWVETFTSDSSTTINLTVPDLRVLNTRTGVLTYHIGTAINAADTGDTIRAWAGTYYENIVVSEEITLEGNGTLTIINGTYSENSIKTHRKSIINALKNYL